MAYAVVGDVASHTLVRDVVAYCWRCGGLLVEMWWLIAGDERAY